MIETIDVAGQDRMVRPAERIAPRGGRGLSRRHRPARRTSAR